MDLEKKYSVNIDQYETQSWHNIIRQFQDANIYQTWPYDMVRYGRKGVDHIILKKEEAVVAAAQVRIYSLPLLQTGIAYVYWGPMWRKKNGAPTDPEIFRNAIRALRNEFSLRRGLVLRIYPLAYRGDNKSLENILWEEGYQFYYKAYLSRTLLIDLGPSLEELRSSLHQNWRHHLNRAEKNGLELVLGEEENLFNEISKIYMEMVDRKGLTELSDVNHLKQVQRDLPPEFKLKVILCRMNGQLCAGAIFSAIGNMGVYLVGATSGVGLKTYGSYMIHWAILKWLKENGFQFYDLNGINPDINPGTYQFKRGLAGKRGIEVEFLGKFQVSDDRISTFVINSGEWLLSKLKKALGYIRSLRNKKG